jgi:hypothetical protein
MERLPSLKMQTTRLVHSGRSSRAWAACATAHRAARPSTIGPAIFFFFLIIIVAITFVLTAVATMLGFSFGLGFLGATDRGRDEPQADRGGHDRPLVEAEAEDWRRALVARLPLHIWASPDPCGGSNERQCCCSARRSSTSLKVVACSSLHSEGLSGSQQFNNKHHLHTPLLSNNKLPPILFYLNNSLMAMLGRSKRW